MSSPSAATLHRATGFGHNAASGLMIAIAAGRQWLLVTVDLAAYQHWKDTRELAMQRAPGALDAYTSVADAPDGRFA